MLKASLNKIAHKLAAAAIHGADDDRFIAGLRHTQSNDALAIDKVEPQTFATDIFCADRVKDAIYPGADYLPVDVRAQFAREVVRKNVIAKIAGERRVDFRIAA